jgi:hypothetical protein
MTVSILARAFFPALAISLAALASSPAAAGGKKYFLTIEEVPTTQVRDACGNGYHVASLFEIFHFTSLKYDAKRGFTRETSGTGPPAGVFGWIQTGGDDVGGLGPTTAGLVNCNGFGSFQAMEFGTVAALISDWNAEPTAVSPWTASSISCSSSRRVWCKQD